jgi:hypothetical protein
MELPTSKHSRSSHPKEVACADPAQARRGGHRETSGYFTGRTYNEMHCPKRRDPLMPFAMKVSGVTNRGIQKSSAPILDERARAAKKNPFLPMSHKPAEAATKKSSAPISQTTPPLVTSSADSESEPIQKGTRVRVRTPTGTTPRGVRIFIMLSAVVVSDAEDGYLEVKYNGDFPRDNVRVARDQVKKMPSSHQ